mmetsp:Transcript_48814/g.129072  ORF Transcript_48814/g.129072 Transcript_48814/m.129072 type:complete len:120 (+) Transcript_48814:30-389(+)
MGTRGRSRSLTIPKEILKADYEAGTIVQIGNLTQHVTKVHLKEIFGMFGEVVKADVSLSSHGVPMGWGYVQFRNRSEAEEAVCSMDGGQVDGSVVSVSFIELPIREDSISSSTSSSSGG